MSIWACPLQWNGAIACFKVRVTLIKYVDSCLLINHPCMIASPLSSKLPRFWSQFTYALKMQNLIHMTDMVQIRLMALILAWFDCIMHSHSFAKTLVLHDTGISHRILANRANTPKEWGWSGGRSNALVNSSIRVWVDYPVSYCSWGDQPEHPDQVHHCACFLFRRVTFVHSRCRIRVPNNTVWWLKMALC